jgi:hypothetical protein
MHHVVFIPWHHLRHGVALRQPTYGTDYDFSRTELDIRVPSPRPSTSHHYDADLLPLSMAPIIMTLRSTFVYNLIWNFSEKLAMGYGPGHGGIAQQCMSDPTGSLTAGQET